MDKKEVSLECPNGTNVTGQTKINEAVLSFEKHSRQPKRKFNEFERKWTVDIPVR